MNGYSCGYWFAGWMGLMLLGMYRVYCQISAELVFKSSGNRFNTEFSVRDSDLGFESHLEQYNLVF